HAACARPGRVDRLIVHQFDARHPIPGGIDTCIRDMARYHSDGTTIAIVGVDASDGERVGRWERVHFGSTSVWFLPVVALNPNDQRRKVPHALRLAAATLRYRRILPNTEVVQAHRADLALFLLVLFRRPLYYFI